MINVLTAGCHSLNIIPSAGQKKSGFYSATFLLQGKDKPAFGKTKSTKEILLKRTLSSNVHKWTQQRKISIETQKHVHTHKYSYTFY